MRQILTWHCGFSVNQANWEVRQANGLLLFNQYSLWIPLGTCLRGWDVWSCVHVPGGSGDRLEILAQLLSNRSAWKSNFSETHFPLFGGKQVVLKMKVTVVEKNIVCHPELQRMLRRWGALFISVPLTLLWLVLLLG